MPRKKIIYLPDLSYHVTSRCIELKDYLKSDIFKFIMEKVIVRTLNKYDFEFNGYVIMPNHVHFYIRTVKGGANIYRIVQYIKSRFAEAFNRKMNRCGHFWNERYKCKITEHATDPEKCCFNVINYLGNNPVRKGIVKDPRDYRFSSFRAYVETDYKSRVKITLHPFYLKLGDTPEERTRKFLIYRKKISGKIKGSDPLYINI